MALCPGFTRTEFQETANAEGAAVPSLLWQTPEPVVKTALRDLRRGAAVSIPGVHNKMAAMLSQLAPRAMVLRSTSKTTAVDHPNSSTPFIAVIGPSNRQLSIGTMSP